MGAFDHLTNQKTVVVTTFRRDGTGVPTPVHIATDGERAYVRSWSTSGKAKRLRREPQVLVAPSTFRGKVTGPEVKAVARRLAGDEEMKAARRIDEKYPLLQGRLVHWAHRIRKYETVHYELVAV